MSARLRLVAVVALLGACKPIAPGPARYACTRELPAESQCLEGWRCGLDNFCFDPAAAKPVPLRCEDPLTDCPTSWKCSLEGQCFDPANPTGASLPCRDPQTDCPTDWKCGLDGRCLDPTQAGPWRCEETARDCTGGWTCGAAGLCFDRADAGRVACREAVTTDCNDGWRCGVDGLCQQRDAGFPWPCRDDSHCEAAWRCGPGERCVDPSGDALRPNAGSPVGARLGLRWPAATPDQVALDRWTEICFRTAQFVAGAARFGRRVELFSVQVEGGPGLPTSCDGGLALGDVPIIGDSIDFAEAPTDLAQIGNVTMVLVDGGVRLLMLEAEQQTRELPFVPRRYTRLRTSESGTKVLATTEQEVDRLSIYGVQEALSVGPLRAVDGGTARIADALVWRVHGKEILVAATDQGLFTKALELGVDAGWTHLQWGVPTTPATEVRLAPQLDGGDMLMARVEVAPSGATRILTFSAGNLVTDLPSSVLSWPGAEPAIYLQPVEVADAGFFVLWQENTVSCPKKMRGWYGNFLGDSPTRGTAFLQCELDDGGTQLQRVVVNPFSSGSVVAEADQEAPITRDARWAPHDDRRLIMVDSTGGLYLAGVSGGAFTLQPWTAGSTPAAVAGRIDDRLLVRDEARPLLLGAAAAQVLVQEGHFVAALDGGILRVSSTVTSRGEGYRLLSAVEGRPDLMVVSLPMGTSPAAVLVQGDDAGFFGPTRAPPVQALSRGPVATTRQVAAASSSVDGGSTWFFTHDDQLLFSQLGAPYPVHMIGLEFLPEVQRVPAMRLALTPLPGAQITHVLALPADGSTGAAFGQALLVAAGRLFHVRADNPVVWRSSEPLATGSEILKTWADGARVRIGDRDGRVLSYPSRVTLAPPLPSGRQTLDYVDVCGVTYALARDGLWRLASSPPSPIGSWERVPLPSGFRFDTAGLLHTDGAGLLVFDAEGRIANVSGLVCAQPL